MVRTPSPQRRRRRFIPAAPRHIPRAWLLSPEFVGPGAPEHLFTPRGPPRSLRQDTAASGWETSSSSSSSPPPPPTQAQPGVRQHQDSPPPPPPSSAERRQAPPIMQLSPARHRAPVFFGPALTSLHESMQERVERRAHRQGTTARDLGSPSRRRPTDRPPNVLGDEDTAVEATVQATREPSEARTAASMGSPGAPPPPAPRR